jgi:hypothetical protein
MQNIVMLRKEEVQSNVVVKTDLFEGYESNNQEDNI